MKAAIAERDAERGAEQDTAGAKEGSGRKRQRTGIGVRTGVGASLIRTSGGANAGGQRPP